MRDALKGILIGLLFLALAGAIASRLGWITPSPPRPDGHGAWMLSRATGLLAYVALGLDVIAGLLVSTRSRVVPRGALVDVHGWLSPLALGFVVAHGGVLLADGYVRFDLLDVAIPFVSTVAIGLGILAGYAMLVVHLSFGLRKRIGVAWWRRLHYLSFATFVLVTAHALAAGTDRGHPWFVSIYALFGLAVAALVALRVRQSRGASASSR